MSSALNKAILRGDTNQVKKLLANGANVHRGTPLILACENKFCEIVLALLETDIDIDQIDYYGKTALFLACEQANFAVAEALILHNADVNYVDYKKVSPLMVACQRNSTEIVRKLIAAGADLNLKDRMGRTALMYNSSITQLLVEAEAELDHQDINGNTALTLACCEGNTALVRSLLSHKANINLCNYRKRSPLCMAKNFEIAIELIKADHPYEYFVTGYLPLQKALSFNFPEYPLRHSFTLQDISLLNSSNYSIVLTLLFCRKNNPNFLLLSNELFELILQQLF